MKIKIDNQQFRVEYEGGEYEENEGFEPYHQEPINIVSIEWLKNGRYIDLTEIIESMDIDGIESKILEGIEVINTIPEP